MNDYMFFNAFVLGSLYDCKASKTLFGSDALSGKMLLVRIVENNRIYYLG